MSRSFAELLPTPLTAESLALLQPLGRAEDLLLLLERWVERGWLRALDKAFVAFLHERDPQGDPLVLLAAALTSHQLGHGHVCLDLFETLKEPDFALSLPPKVMCKPAPCCCLRNCLRPWTARPGARHCKPARWLNTRAGRLRMQPADPWY